MYMFFNKMLSLTISILILPSLMFVISTTSTLSAEEIEEKADTVLYNDTVVTGAFDEYKGQAVIVEGTRYFICSKIKAFSPRNGMIDLKDIEGAEEVKLFIDGTCVRKIKVLRFSE